MKRLALEILWNSFFTLEIYVKLKIYTKYHRFLNKKLLIKSIEVKQLTNFISIIPHIFIVISLVKTTKYNIKSVLMIEKVSDCFTSLLFTDCLIDF